MLIHNRTSQPCAVVHCQNRTERRIHRLCGKRCTTNRRCGHPEQCMLRKHGPILEAKLSWVAKATRLLDCATNSLSPRLAIQSNSA